MHQQFYDKLKQRRLVKPVLWFAILPLHY